MSRGGGGDRRFAIRTIRQAMVHARRYGFPQIKIKNQEQFLHSAQRRKSRP